MRRSFLNHISRISEWTTAVSVVQSIQKLAKGHQSIIVFLNIVLTLTKLQMIGFTLAATLSRILFLVALHDLASIFLRTFVILDWIFPKISQERNSSFLMLLIGLIAISSLCNFISEKCLYLAVKRFHYLMIKKLLDEKSMYPNSGESPLRKIQNNGGSELFWLAIRHIV